MVHIERMDKNVVWIGISKNDLQVSLLLVASGPIIVRDGDGNLEEFFK